MKIQEETAKLFAIKHVEKLDLKGFRYEFVEIHLSRIDNQWVAVFDCYGPKGNLIDGPVIFLVDRNTGFVEVEEGP